MERSAAQLVDALVDHLGVYDRSQSWPRRDGSAPARGAAQRSAEGDALRRWLRKLSPAARREALTLNDAPWVSVRLL